MLRLYSRPMTETRPNINAVSPDPRMSSGILGYVAEVEQFDPTMAGALTASESVATPASTAAAVAGFAEDEAEADDDDAAADGIASGASTRIPAQAAPEAVVSEAEPDDAVLVGSPGTADPAGITLIQPGVDPCPADRPDLGDGSATWAGTDEATLIDSEAQLTFTPIDSWFFSFDEPTADEPTADEPTADEPTADEPAAVQPTAGVRDETREMPAPSFDDGDTVEFPAIAGEPPVDVSGRPGRFRLVALAGVMLALLGGAGIGWAMLDRAPGHQEADTPPAAIPSQESNAAPGFSTGERPGATVAGGPSPSAPESVRPESESGGAAASVPPSPSAGAVAGQGAPGRSGGGVAAEWASPRPGKPARPARPAEPVQPGGGGGSPVEQAPVSYVTASFTRSATVVPMGLADYQATVRIDNGGSSAVDGWQITLMLSGENAVRNVQGAQMNQNGSTVVFTPVGGTRSVPAGGSVTFTFNIGGVLAGDPTSCTVDGRSCTVEDPWEHAAMPKATGPGKKNGKKHA